MGTFGPESVISMSVSRCSCSGVRSCINCSSAGETSSGDTGVGAMSSISGAAVAVLAGTSASRVPGCPGNGGCAFSWLEGILSIAIAGVAELPSGLSAGGEVAGVFSFIGSFDPAVLESAVLASAFCGDGAEFLSGLAVIGFAARLSSSSVAFGPQHRNERNFGGPFLFSVNARGDPLSGVVGCCFSVILFGA